MYGRPGRCILWNFLHTFLAQKTTKSKDVDSGISIVLNSCEPPVRFSEERYTPIEFQKIAKSLEIVQFCEFPTSKHTEQTSCCPQSLFKVPVAVNSHGLPAKCQIGNYEQSNQPIA
jgi:hypothetical protein